MVDIVAACCLQIFPRDPTEMWNFHSVYTSGKWVKFVSLFAEYSGQHSGPLRRRKRTVQPQTDELRGRRACALTARGPIKLVGGAAQGSADCRKNWTTALGAVATVLVPPARSTLKQRVLHGEKAGTRQRKMQ